MPLSYMCVRVAGAISFANWVSDAHQVFLSQLRSRRMRPGGYLGAKKLDEHHNQSDRDDESWRNDVGNGGLDRRGDVDDEEISGEHVLFSPFCRVAASVNPTQAQATRSCVAALMADGKPIDDFGFVVEHDCDAARRRAFAQESRLRLEWIATIEFQESDSASRDLTWDKMQHKIAKTARLRSMVLTRGIAHALRQQLWLRLSGAIEKKLDSEMSYRDIVRHSGLSPLSIQGASVLRLNLRREIDSDMANLLPHNVLYSDDKSAACARLRRYLEALAWLYPNIGYRREVATFAAMLLLVLDEEPGFWLLCMIIEELLPASYFAGDSLGAKADQRVLDDLLLDALPKVHEVIKRHELDLSVWTLGWFQTLYVQALTPYRPLLLLRFFDWFFYDGSQTLFFFTLALIQLQEEAILEKADDAAAICNILANMATSIVDMEDVMKVASTMSELFSPDDVISARQNHMAQLMADSGFLINPDSALSGLPRQKVQKRNLRHASTSTSVLFYSSGSLDDDAKEKNVRQTELIVELREAVLQIARHFAEHAGGSSSGRYNIKADYSPESHLKDRQLFNRVSRSKYRRARALIDFERHEDDELGFRRNDVITVISQRDDHCWVGELNGGRGWFPARFVELLDERSKQYSPLGDDSADDRISNLVRNTLCNALLPILQQGMKRSVLLGGSCHPWLFIEEAAEREVERDMHGVNSRLQLCKAFRLDEDCRLLSPEELLFKAVKAISASHDACHAQMDVKLRSLICVGLNEQCLHLWLEVICSAAAVLEKWYQPQAFLRSPVWMQIKCELRLLAQFPFTLRHDYELPASKARQQAKASSSSNPLKDSVRDLLVRYHLFSWELQG